MARACPASVPSSSRRAALSRRKACVCVRVLRADDAIRRPKSSRGVACFVRVRAELATAHKDGAQARILVVDDDDNARSALAKLLSADGYTVTTAANGEIALAAAQAALPDLVLTDIEMPRMTGVVLCQRLHELDRDLPVIVMTAHSDMDSAVASLRAGAEDYLSKPLQYEAVLWRVQRTLARRALALEQLEASRRHEQEREEYLALISHDLLNPLSNVLMCVAMLKESMHGKKLLADFKLADRAEQNAKRMTAMLKELTEATGLESRAVALDTVKCDLLELVTGIVYGMNEARASRITVEGDGEETHFILADRSRVERVVTNLLTNALKYSAEDAPVHARIARHGSAIHLTVADRGIGIPRESVELLFDRYFRTAGGKARATGLGLGLYIARLIVETHGGSIDVTSELGAGSTFQVTLPAYVVPS